MNICFVSKEYPIDGNYDSGIGRYLSELVNELKKKNKVVILTTSDKTKIIREKNLTIYTLSPSRFLKRSFAFFGHQVDVAIHLTRIIKREKIDIIEFANWECEGLLFTKLINIFLKIPVVVRLHTPSAIDHKFNKRKKYFSEKLTEYFEKMFVNQKQNYLTTSTKFNAKLCRRIYNLKDKPIEIIPLGVKPKKISIQPLTIGHQPLTILYVGRLEPRKGVDILLAVIPRVLKKNRNINFVIVGRENADNKWLANLKDMIPYNNLDKVNFLGYINNLEKIYKYADICVVPSRYESFGLVVLDSMNYGKVTVANHVGGIPEIITDNFDGILVNNLKPTSLALAIIKSLDLNFRKEIMKNARNTVVKRFDVKNTTSQTLKYYNQLVGQ